MHSDHQESSWTLGQLATPFGFLPKAPWAFLALAVGSQGCFFSGRGWLSIAVLSLFPSASWPHSLVRFLSNLNAELCFYAAKISPCQFQLSFPPASALKKLPATLEVSYQGAPLTQELFYLLLALQSPWTPFERESSSPSCGLATGHHPPSSSKPLICSSRQGNARPHGLCEG